MSDQPYCRICKYFEESDLRLRCAHPKAQTFDRVHGEIKPIIDFFVISQCDLLKRFEPKG